MNQGEWLEYELVYRFFLVAVLQEDHSVQHD